MSGLFLSVGSKRMAVGRGNDGRSVFCAPFHGTPATFHGHDHDDPVVQAQRASEMEAKAIENKSFTNKLHSAIRWNRNPDKWMALLSARDDAKDMQDLVNGNFPIHIAAQVCVRM